MKIIVPMAGMGKRMRPHTLTTPKPLIPIAGKPIVQRLVEDIAGMVDEKIEEVAYVIGDFGQKVEQDLADIAAGIGARSSIYYQDEPLGTGHAILCAGPSLSGNLVVAFADTLFNADIKLDPEQDGSIWTKEVENPSSFGVVQTDANGLIHRFVEKPKEHISNLAIIGIYYFKDGEMLRSELQYLIDNDIKDKGEFQLTNALENMKNKGLKLKALTVKKWLDCGNKDATVDTNREVLEMIRDEELISENAEISNSIILKPCYIASGAKISNSVVGPSVSVGPHTLIESSVVKNSIIMNDSQIINSNLANSMIGSHVEYEEGSHDVSIGDFSKLKL
ncbi:MAG: sugar phosphate nucleotidyltransferase [Bacteroidia bacterium]